MFKDFLGKKRDPCLRIFFVKLSDPLGRHILVRPNMWVPPRIRPLSHSDFHSHYLTFERTAYRGFSCDVISSRFCKSSHFRPPCWFPLCMVQYRKIELAQFHVTALGGGGPWSGPLSALVKGHCLYQTSSRGGGYNLTRFGSPDAGLKETQEYAPKLLSSYHNTHTQVEILIPVMKEFKNKSVLFFSIPRSTKRKPWGRAKRAHIGVYCIMQTLYSGNLNV